MKSHHKPVVPIKCYSIECDEMIDLTQESFDARERNLQRLARQRDLVRRIANMNLDDFDLFEKRLTAMEEEPSAVVLGAAVRKLGLTGR